MSKIVTQVRKGFFLDSVALMRISQTIAGLPGVEEAALMMGTPANKEIMAVAGLLDAQGEAATGGDLVFGIRAEDEVLAQAALATASDLLIQPRASSDDAVAWQPKSLRTALPKLAVANLALISVPGDYAGAEARKALSRDLNVMIFSDNVSLDEERALKAIAAERGLLVMGPDCGTAIVSGVPLGFANEVPRGDVGIVGASGTGIQEVSSLVARAGGGISHAFGVGGRDLSSAIGGQSTLVALELLEEDDATRHIVLISKPPAPEVATKVMDHLSKSQKEVTVCLIGGGEFDAPAKICRVDTLKAAAMSASANAQLPKWNINDEAQSVSPQRRGVRGLFAGGTLAAEAQYVFLAAGEAVSSNAPIPGGARWENGHDGHVMIDLGSDEYTLGRPHPMIDPSVRDGPLADALNDKMLGVVLLDVVIGFGAHEDPSGHIARIVEATDQSERPVVVASVTGTDSDPQGRAAQERRLDAAGVLVAPSNADAAELALACLQSG